jgi:hypothetical protein
MADRRQPTPRRGRALVAEPKAAGELELRLSAAKGHPLADLDVPGPIVDGLAQLDVHDAEQFLALGAAPETRADLVGALNISSDELDNVVRHVEQFVSPRIASVLAAPGELDLSTGVLVPTDEIAARLAAIPVMAEAGPVAALPSSHNFLRRLPPIRNQAARGTCVAFTLTALHEFYYRSRNRTIDFSEQYLYYRTKQIDGAPYVCGTRQSDAARVLTDRGQCRETLWSYNPDLPCNQQDAAVPPNADGDAASYKLQLQALNPKDVDGIKAALAVNRPVGISIPVWRSWYTSADTRRTGRITMRIGNESGPAGQPAGHAVCLVGYQDSAQAPGGGYFILRNSWSTNWGSECPHGPGYGTIPYQYIASENWEAFTLPPRRVSPSGPGEVTDEDATRVPDGEGRRTIRIVVGDVTIEIR